MWSAYKEPAHFSGFHAGGNHPVQRAALRAHRGVEIAELSGQRTLDDGPLREGCPAAGGIAHSTKARLILEQQQKRFVTYPLLLLYRFIKPFREFFLNDS